MSGFLDSLNASWVPFGPILVRYGSAGWLRNRAQSRGRGVGVVTQKRAPLWRFSLKRVSLRSRAMTVLQVYSHPKLLLKRSKSRCVNGLAHLNDVMDRRERR